MLEIILVLLGLSVIAYVYYTLMVSICKYKQCPKCGYNMVITSFAENYYYYCPCCKHVIPIENKNIKR